VNTLTFVWALTVVSTEIHIDHPFFEYKLDSYLKWFSFIFVWGYCSGVGGLAGHELIHKKEKIHKFFGTFAFSKFLYSHFFMEHISGHHKKVATPEDPATPTKGDNLYYFVTRSVILGFHETWQRENERVNLLYLS